MLPLFATPWAFLALAALPTLAAIYVLRHSYRRVNVSSLMLWLDLAESRASGLKVRRLQTPLLFFLELAALALLALAATGPRLEVGPGARPLVVVLDNSFSMRAGGDDSARARALAALKTDLRTSSFASLRFVLAGQTPQALGDSVESISHASSFFEEWRCGAAAARWPEALALAAELGGDKARLLVITDHAPTEEPKTGRLAWWSFGEPRANVAIIRAGRGIREDQDRVAFEIANYADAFHDATVVVETVPGGREVHRERLTLGPRDLQRRALRLALGAGPLRVRILESDALDVDNLAYLAPEEMAPIRVDVRTGDERLRELFEKAFRATGKTLPPGTRPDLVVTDSGEMPKVDAETWVLHALQEKEADAYLGPFVLERTHPLTEGLGLAGVVWGAGKSADVSGAPVVLAGNVPLVTDTEAAPGQHRIRLRLRPDLSSLPQSPAWPVFVWNLVTWRASGVQGLHRVNLRLGETAVLSVRAGVKLVELTPPSGGSRTIEVKAQQAALVADEPGIYEVHQDGKTSVFAVSAQSPEESDLKGCVTGRWGEWSEESDAPPGLVSLAWILCLLALGVLTGHLYFATRG